MEKIKRNRRRFFKEAGVALGTLAVGAATAATDDRQLTKKNQNQEGPLKLLGKIALVTGAARGIGLATACELALQGADVAMLDIADPFLSSDDAKYISGAIVDVTAGGGARYTA